MFKGKLTGKSFDPEKCKLQLKLAITRIKLLRSRRGAMVNQLRSDIAHLLQLGQNQTALLQVEDVIKEEKAVAAYDILTVFCEHILPNMHTIVSHKNCSPDLKDAIASIIYASGMCGNIPELQNVCKCFEIKYGRKFVTSATELHPNSGVYITLIDKLSPRPPEGKIKLRTLINIAKEHDVQWDPRSLDEDLDPLGDTIQGGYAVEGTSNEAEFQIKHDGIPNQVVRVCVESSKKNDKHQQLNISVMIPNARSSSGMEVQLTPSREGKTDVRGMENEEMEFRDATSAAEAAAEAAERASKLARQAVELSIRGKFPQKIGPDILNVKQQEENKCSYDYDVLSTESYTATEGDSNVNLTNEGSTVLDESKLGYDVRKSSMIIDDDPTTQAKNDSEVQSEIKDYVLIRKHVSGSAVSQRTKK